MKETKHRTNYYNLMIVFLMGVFFLGIASILVYNLAVNDTTIKDSYITIQDLRKELLKGNEFTLNDGETRIRFIPSKIGMVARVEK